MGDAAHTTRLAMDATAAAATASQSVVTASRMRVR